MRVFTKLSSVIAQYPEQSRSGILRRKDITLYNLCAYGNTNGQVTSRFSQQTKNTQHPDKLTQILRVLISNFIFNQNNYYLTLFLQHGRFYKTGYNLSRRLSFNWGTPATPVRLPRPAPLTNTLELTR